MTNARAGGGKSKAAVAAMRPIWVWDPDRLRIASANRAAVELWGETGLVELLERDFDPEETYAREMRRALDDLRGDENDLVSTPLIRRLAFAPAGEPLRLRAEIRRAELDEGRVGLQIAVSRQLFPAEAETERQRDILQAAPVAMALFDDAGRPIWRNPAAERVFADADASFEARYADMGLARRALGAALLDGAFSHIADLKTRTGDRAHRVSLRRVTDPVSGSVAVIGYFADVAERRSGAHASADGALFDAIDAGAALLDLRSGAIRHVNPAARRLLNLAEHDAAPKLASVFEEDAGKIAAALADLRAGARRHVKLDLFRAEAGALGQWLTADLRLFEADDSAALMTLTDVSRERRALLYLKFEEAERTTALEGLGVATLSIDPQGRILRAGRLALDYLGLDSAEGADLAERLDPLTAKRLETYLTQGPIAAGRQLELGVQATLLPAGGGVERPVRLAISGEAPRENARRTVALIPESAAPPAVDLSRAAPSSVLDSDQALARVSHELRTPLNSILGFVDLLRSAEHPADAEKRDEYLGDIAEAAGYMLTLVEDLLTIKRAEATRALGPIETIDLVDLSQRLIRSVRQATPNGASTIRLDAEPGAPEVLVDPKALRQALSNLIANAANYAGPDGLVTVTIAREDDGALSVEVADDGPGLTRKEIEEALTPFARPSMDRPPVSGFGLGLPLARALAETCGARFEIDSAPGAGTAVRLTFPPDRLAAA